MINDIISVFEKEYKVSIITIDIDGEIYCRAREIINALGYTNISKAIKDRCLEEGVKKISDNSNGGKQSYIYISCKNVYRLILTSKKKSAKEFQLFLYDILNEKATI